jgi:hypothetical protein
VFGQIKQARGFRQFLLRAVEKVRAEWAMVCRVSSGSAGSVSRSNLYQRGYGEAGRDFLTSSRIADNIVTNPPYNCAEGGPPPA